MEALTLTLTFSIITAFSQATPTLVTHPQPQMNLSSMLNHTQQHINETKLIDGRGGFHHDRGRFTNRCDYLITIKTSCDSPTNTKDEISVLFGDAYGAEVYVPKLVGPYGCEPFKKCSTFSFEVMGQCISNICQLYLYRKGTNGWVPETVVVYDYNYPPVIFNYNYYLSDGPGTGYNYCPKP
ncbi:embryo-specific protein ATS3B-like [Trifolium pratense]|uniref:embryo-specific protein ATS3B-like n=1 Tax=Trifolium pratense TaxID=57577 RepID=UPI001E692EDF|nr:embryo-specific protein ATS3B-like [Trifolium pratense]